MTTPTLTLAELRELLAAARRDLADHIQANEALMAANKSLAAKRDGLLASLHLIAGTHGTETASPRACAAAAIEQWSRRQSPAPGVPTAGTDPTAEKLPEAASIAPVAADNPGAGGSGEEKACPDYYGGNHEWTVHSDAADRCICGTVRPANPQPPKLLGPVDALRAELIEAFLSYTSARGSLCRHVADRLERPA